MVRLESGIVALLAKDGAILSTGFMIGRKLIVTCAHVIENVLEEQLTIRCHEDGQTVAALLRPNSLYKEFDVAVLEVSNALSSVRPLPVGSADDSEGDPFRTFGYPILGDYVGLPASGTVDGFAHKADSREFLQLVSSNLNIGFSGAPVWNVRRERVEGMISEVYLADSTGRHRNNAYAVPGDTLLRLTGEASVDDSANQIMKVSRIQLTSETYRELRTALLDCGPFDSDERVRQLFVVHSLQPWQHLVPQASSPAARVDALINLLHDRENRDGANALLLFLQALQETLNRDDACYERVGNMIGRLIRD